jgi:hypothetical protein
MHELLRWQRLFRAAALAKAPPAQPFAASRLHLQTTTLGMTVKIQREYLAHLHELENAAKAAKRGAWAKVKP